MKTAHLKRYYHALVSGVIMRPPLERNFALVHLLAVIVFVWLWEACGVFSILNLYRIEDNHDLLDFLSHLDGKLFFAGAMLFACTSLVIRWKYVALQENGIHPLRFIVKWNILPLIFIITLAEVALRVFSTDTPLGTMLGERALGPRRLELAVHNPQAVDKAFYYDQLLGWTVKPNLSNSDELYSTSVEGIRSHQPGNILGSTGASCRVALVGDSHTFGEELKFEDTWGYHLEEDLLKRCQVLNFGVPGYSVGQMYLRYMQDVRRWHPTVIILALSSNSSARTMGVYGLNMFPQSIPWAQPRFQLKDHDPVPINIPLPTLEEIASARSMSELPFIDYDRYFVPGSWELHRWRYLYNSYLFRLYTTRFPLKRTEPSGDSEEAINHELLQSFLRTSKTDGSLPLILYLPDKDDYREPVHKETPSLKALRTSGVDYVDLRSCLDMVDANNRFIAHGFHYSRNGSIAIARCIVARLPQRLWERSL